jgi:hypothetical protein
VSQITGLLDERGIERLKEIQKALEKVQGAAGPPTPDDVPTLAGILWRSFPELKRPGQSWESFRAEVYDALNFQGVDVTPSVAPLPTGGKPSDTFFSLTPRATITAARAKEVADALLTGRETRTGAALAIPSSSGTMPPERRRAVVDQLVSGRGSHTTGAALSIDEKAPPPERRQQIVDELGGKREQAPTPTQQQRLEAIIKCIRKEAEDTEQANFDFRLQSLENYFGINRSGSTLP